MALNRRALRHTAYLADAVTQLEARVIALEAAGGGVGDMTWGEFQAIVADSSDYASFATAVGNVNDGGIT